MHMYFKLFVYAIFTLATGSLWAAKAAHVVFVAGSARIAGQLAQVGSPVSEGQKLSTGPDGYLYLETIDKGFFILRPNSTGQIVTYHIDPLNPANHRIKLELENGVARHISGDAVKSSRHNFRFNTPVAAVGVRGTDFTIFASQDTTRITVLSGGVVVSPLTDTCSLSGIGPCDGPASRELFANKVEQILQVQRGQLPVLLQGFDQAPDAVTPPRADEPSGVKSGVRNTPAAHATPVDLNLDPLKSSLLNQLSQQVGSPPAPMEGPPSLLWGRWQPVLDQGIEVNVAALQATSQLIATNTYYALMRTRDAAWQPPAQASLGFALQQSQALILNESSRQTTPAALENGQLKINFGQSSFITQFDLVNNKERFTLQNSGEISRDGRLYGGLQFLRPNNMDVRGALASDNLSAAYLFQSRLDEHRVASGATYWGK